MRLGTAQLDRSRARVADFLRRSSALRATKRRVARHVTGQDPVAIVERLALFAPYSAGHFPARADLTMLAARQTFPLLLSLQELSGREVSEPVDIATFCATEVQDPATEELRALFDRHGSDKATDHDYHLLYGLVLADRQAVRRVLEIGLGTNHPDVVSSMGISGRPGASLRAFRDFLPLATVYGADVDDRILFSEDRIMTCRVDQTDLRSFDELSTLVGDDELDLIIDDGLHAPNANLAVLLFGLRRLRAGGWLVVEDISPDAIPIWQVVSGLLPSTHHATVVLARGGVMFAVQRVA